LLVERPEDGVVLVRLNRPERLNAIDEQLLAELLATFEELSEDRSAHVIVLSSVGRGFCSGLDMRDFGPSMPAAGEPPLELLRFQEHMASLPLALRALPQPVLAAVNGPAYGGGLSLCLAADLRICSPSATFGNGAIAIGLSGAEMGMSYLLPRAVGAAVAADWMLTGRAVSAAEALERGLVSEVVDDTELQARALELAATLAAGSPLALQLTKAALQANVDAPSLVAAMELENRNQVIAHGSEEAAAARQRWDER
jgi:enoyl-CoA hydratase/carnithine racemase